MPAGPGSPPRLLLHEIYTHSSCGRSAIGVSRTPVSLLKRQDSSPLSYDGKLKLVAGSTPADAVQSRLTPKCVHFCPGFSPGRHQRWTRGESNSYSSHAKGQCCRCHYGPENSTPGRIRTDIVPLKRRCSALVSYGGENGAGSRLHWRITRRRSDGGSNSAHVGCNHVPSQDGSTRLVKTVSALQKIRTPVPRLRIWRPSPLAEQSKIERFSPPLKVKPSFQRYRVSPAFAFANRRTVFSINVQWRVQWYNKARHDAGYCYAAACRSERRS